MDKPRTRMSPLTPGRDYDFNNRAILAHYVRIGKLHANFRNMTPDAQRALVKQTIEGGYESIAELLFDQWLETHINGKKEDTDGA